MDNSDRDRLDLYNKLEAILGAKEAGTLMAHLSPFTWQHLATKDDLRSELHVLGADLRTEMHRGFNRTIMWLAGLMVSWSAVTIAAIGIMT